MTAPTAREVLKSLDRHEQSMRMQALVSLDAAAQAEIRRALSAVKPRARVDVRVLVATVRSAIEQRRRESDLTPAEQAELREFIHARVARWRAECDRRGVTDSAARYALSLQLDADAGNDPGQPVYFPPGSSGASVAAKLDAIASRLRTTADKDVAPEEPDDDLDDDAPREPRRKSIPRVPSRRAGQTRDEPAVRTRAAPKQEERVSARLSRAAEPSYLGPRLLGDGIDYDPRAWTPRPPWLLDPGDDEEPDQEIDDDIVDETRVGAR